MNVNVIGVPLFLGCDIEGVDFSPEVLRQNNILDIIRKNGHTVYDLGDLHVPQTEKQDIYKTHDNMKYLEPIVEVNTNLAHLVYSSLLSGSFPFVIGGDHSLGLGSMSGAAKFNEDMAVIWIDAHGDINTEKTSPSGNVHGMPLAAAMGFGHEALTDLYYKGVKVKPENVYILGARDLDEGEISLINELNLNVWSTIDIQTKGPHAIMKEVFKKLQLNNTQHIHVSFDIDSMDATLVPGTGTPVLKGLSLEEVKYILKVLMESKKISSMDFVELNSILDKDSITLNTALELINWVFSWT